MELPARPDPPVLDPRLEAAALEVLAAPPRVPRQAALFTSDVLFGEPGIYPDGPPMAPATGDAPDEHLARAALATLLPDHLGEPPAVAAALGLYDEPTLHRLGTGPAPPGGSRHPLRHRRGPCPRRGRGRSIHRGDEARRSPSCPAPGASWAPTPTAPLAPGS